MLRFTITLLAVTAFACAAGDYGAEPPKDSRPVRKDKEAANPPHGHAGHAHDDAEESADESSLPAEIAAPPMAALDFSIIEMLAIQEGGRKKPLQTYAHEQIEMLVGRPIMGQPRVEDKFTPGGGRKFGTMDIFLSLWTNPSEWSRVPVVLVPKSIKEELNFPMTEKHFSFERLRREKKFKALLESAMAKVHDGKEKELSALESDAQIVEKRMQLVFTIMRGNETLAIVPHFKDETGTWLSMQAMRDSYEKSDKQYYKAAQATALLEKFNAFAKAYRAREPEAFETASRDFRASLSDLSPTVYPSFETLSREVRYNKARAFNWAWICYLAATVLGVLVFRSKSKVIFAIPVGFFILGFFCHVYGFVLRCMIAGRPPVSNMYESVIWVGLGAVFFGTVFELIYRKRYFLLSGAAAAFLALVTMEVVPALIGNSKAAGFGAEISPLQPVLRDNFWLTVHVLTITLSYAAFMLTWVLGHVTLAQHLFRPEAKAEHHQLHQFVYRGMQIGVLLLACGTILGGVWAYYSWGRFWGWDPKETWAFIGLMCYLVVLHGRFTGWWGNFGMSAWSVVCFQAIVFAWYGVNFWLGTGLHAYGSGAGGANIVFPIMGADVLFTFVAVVYHWHYQNKSKMKLEDGGLNDGQDHTLTATDPVDEVRALGHSAGE